MKEHLEIMRSVLSRSWLIAVPLVCLSVGCNSATDSTAVAQAPSEAPTEAPAATPSQEPSHAPVKISPDKTKGGKSGADPAYKISDPLARYGLTAEDMKQAPPEMKAKFSAMSHVKVPPPAKDMKVPDKAKVIFETSKGKITVELNGKAAPLHVKSFLYLTKLGFFDKTTIHRFADLMGGGQGRIAQGGDPFTKVKTTEKFAGEGGPGYEIPRERNALKHTAMVLAAARSQDPNSAGSQFYFTLDPVSFLDDGDGYTVFGKVVGGKDVVLKLKEGDAVKKVTVAK